MSLRGFAGIGLLLAFTLAVVPPGEAIVVGEDDLLTAEVKLARVPECRVGIDREICLLGLDDSDTPLDVGDDTAYVYQATERIAIRANTAPLSPTGLDEFLPNRISVNSATTGIESPLFPTLGKIFLRINDSRPDAIRPFVRCEHNPERTRCVVDASTVTGETPLPKWVGIPISHVLYNVTNLTHIKPLDNDLVSLEPVA